MAIELRTIKIKRDTSINWSTENPILVEGELGVDLDNRLVKLGDGVTSWNVLPVLVKEATVDVDEVTGAITINSTDALTLTSVTDMLQSSGGQLTLASGDTLNIISNSGNSDVIINGQKYIFGASEYDATTYFQILGNSLIVNETDNAKLTIKSDDAVDGLSLLRLENESGSFYEMSHLFNGDFTISSDSFTPFVIQSGATDSLITLKTAGRVDIGSGSEVGLFLQVFGNMYVEDSIVLLSTTLAQQTIENTALGTANILFKNANGSWGVGTTGSTAQLKIQDVTNTKDNVIFYPYTATTQEGFMNFFDYSTNLTTNRFFIVANRDGANSPKAQGIKLLDKSIGASENVELLVFDKDSSITNTQYGGRNIRIGTQDGAGSYLSNIAFINSFATNLGGSLKFSTTSSSDGSTYSMLLGETGNLTLESLASTDIDFTIKNSIQDYKIKLASNNFILKDETNAVEFLTYTSSTGALTLDGTLTLTGDLTMNGNITLGTGNVLSSEFITATESLKIPLDEPTVLENGQIWIA